MGIRRVCSYHTEIKTPEPPDTYSEILVTFQQEQQNIIVLRLDDTDNLVLGDEKVTVQLDQEQTALFKAGIPAFLQIRCYKDRFKVPGSHVWTLDVYPSLNETILTGATP